MEEKGTYRVARAVVGFALLLCFGLIYAWSLFIEPLEAEFGWQRSETSLIFTLSIITFCFGMLLAGFAENRLSARAGMVVTAAAMALGFVAASFTSSLLWIIAFYGVFVGLAIGFGTNWVMAIVLKWFPDKQGFASGALVMGFGLGTMVLSPFVTMLLSAVGWRMTFLVLGAFIGIAVLLASIAIKLPPASYEQELLDTAHEAATVSQRDYTGSQMIRTMAFWKYFCWCTLITCGGLGLISQAVPAAQEVLSAAQVPAAQALATATAAMGSISAFNGLGRLLNGFLWDRIGFKLSLRWISLAFVLGMLLCAFAIQTASFPLVVAGFVVLGLMYGAAMATMPAMMGTFFGTKHFAMNYAIITFQMIPAAFIGPGLLAAMQTSSGSYLQAFWAFLAVAALAFAMSFVVKRPS